jgi:hypothetical protein
VAPDVIVEMNDDFNFVNITKFIREHNHELLGQWSFASIADVSRLFAVVVTNSSDTVKNFTGIATKVYGKFAWGKLVVEKDFPTFNIQESDLPAVVIVKGDRYFKFVNAENLSAVEEWIGRFDGDIKMIPYESLKKQEEGQPCLREMQMKVVFRIIKWTVAIAIPVWSAIAYIFVKWYNRHEKKKKQMEKQD